MKGNRFFKKNGKSGCLLIHGLTSTTQEMQGLYHFLNSKKYTVLATLLKGHNTSPDDLRRTAWRDWYGSVEKDFDFLSRKCGKIYVIGLSIGAILALHLAAKTKSSKIKGLVLLAPAIFYVSPLVKLAPLLHPLKKYSIKDYSKHYPSRREVFFDIADENALKKRIAYKKVPLKSLASALNLIKAVKKEMKMIYFPALIIHSVNDHTVKAKSSKFIYDNLSTSLGNKRLVLLKRSGHVITEDFDKKSVFNEVYAFLQRADKVTLL